MPETLERDCNWRFYYLQNTKILKYFEISALLQIQTTESLTSSTEVIVMSAVHFFQELRSAREKYCVNHTDKEGKLHRD